MAFWNLVWGALAGLLDAGETSDGRAEADPDG